MESKLAFQFIVYGLERISLNFGTVLPPESLPTCLP